MSRIIRLETGFSGPIAPEASLYGTGILARDDDMVQLGRLRRWLGVEFSDLDPIETLEGLAEATLAGLRLTGIEEGARVRAP